MCSPLFTDLFVKCSFAAYRVFLSICLCAPDGTVYITRCAPLSWQSGFSLSFFASFLLLFLQEDFFNGRCLHKLALLTLNMKTAEKLLMQPWQQLKGL